MFISFLLLARCSHQYLSISGLLLILKSCLWQQNLIEIARAKTCRQLSIDWDQQHSAQNTKICGLCLSALWSYVKFLPLPFSKNPYLLKIGSENNAAGPLFPSRSVRCWWGLLVPYLCCCYVYSLELTTPQSICNITICDTKAFTFKCFLCNMSSLIFKINIAWGKTQQLLFSHVTIC